MSISVEMSQQRWRTFHPDRKLYVPRPRRHVDAQRKPLALKHRDDPQPAHLPGKEVDEPSAEGRIVVDDRQTERSHELGDKKANNTPLPFQQCQPSQKKVQRARKGTTSSLSEKRVIPSVRNHQFDSKATPIKQPSQHPSPSPSRYQSPVRNHMAGNDHRSGPRGGSDHSKPKPDLPQFLKENRHAMNRAIQASRPLRSDDIISMMSGRSPRQRDPNTPASKASAFAKPLADPGVQEHSTPHLRANGTPNGTRSHHLPHEQTATPNNLPIARVVDNSTPPKPIGTWDATDAFAKPQRKRLITHDHIDFRSRPPTDTQYTLPYTVVDKNGKHVPQIPIGASHKADFPPLPETMQTPEKAATAQSVSTPVIRQVKDYPGDFTALPSRSNDHAPVNKKDLPELAQDQKKPSTPELKGIMRYFSRVTPRQSKPVHPATMTAVPPIMNDKPNTPAPTPAPKPIKGGLLTNGSDFLTLALATRKRSSHQPENSSVPIETLAEPLGSSVDEVVANINAKTVATLESVKPESSNESVRGRADAKMSIISGSLNFDDTFQGRDASVASHKSVVLYQGRQANNPYRTSNQVHDSNPPVNWEDGQLHGWDGKWAPAPLEWDRRDMYDYRKPQHRESIRNFVMDRYQAFKNGLCPALNVESSEDFTSGASLAVGHAHFGAPINPVDHHHVRAADPFTLNKLPQTAASSTETYCRNNKDRLEAKAEKKKAKRLTEEEKDEMGRKHEEMLRNMPPNPFKPVANIYIRPARLKDLVQIRAIHNHYTRTSAVTQERVELGDREIRSRFDECVNERYPFIVAISRHGRTAAGNEVVVGFAFAEDFGGENTMWRHTCEVQFYVDPRHLRKGIGKNLLDTLLRGVTPYYHFHNGVPFQYTDAEYERHDGGGARIVSQIMVPFPYFADEEAKHQWMGPWLKREFEFEHQGTLKGVGHAGIEDKP
ncbi:MAG: hypothetical protein Q9210_005601 [Variospora velana]